MLDDDNDIIHAQLLAAARQTIAARGLAGVSVRSLAQDIGKSTFVLFSRFRNRAAVLLAAADSARQDDALSDASFFAAYAGLRLTPIVMVDIVFAYLRCRSASELGRVWLECLSAAHTVDDLPQLLGRWYYERSVRWRDFLGKCDRPTLPATVWIDLLIMEEFYAAALFGQHHYELVLREDLQTLFGVPAHDGGGDVTVWLSQKLDAQQFLPEAIDAASLKGRLLDAAADQIVNEGADSVTNSRASLRVGTSTSMIAYHFGSVAHFVDQAMLHALMRGMPNYLAKTASQPEVRPGDLDAWADLVGPTALPAAPGAHPRDSSFYVNYARVLNQACLRTRQTPDFGERILGLRISEGEGTYRAREIAWPAGFAMTRTEASNFAIWIKGYAFINAVLARSPEAAALREALQLAARSLMRN